jgi:thiol:disulfide interchange protein DsbD
MRKIVLILIFSLLLGCIGEEDSIKTPEPTETPAITETPKEKTSITWVYDVEEAKEIAKNGNKLILIDFNADNCGWCRKLEEITYKEEGVIKLVNENFVPVFFDLDIKANKEIYVQKYQVYVHDALPTLLILDSEGKALYRITGYKTGEQLTELLDKVLLEVEQ